MSNNTMTDEEIEAVLEKVKQLPDPLELVVDIDMTEHYADVVAKEIATMWSGMHDTVHTDDGDDRNPFFRAVVRIIEKVIAHGTCEHGTQRFTIHASACEPCEQKDRVLHPYED